MNPFQRSIMKHPISIAIGLTLVGCFLLVGYVVLMDKTNTEVFITGFISLLALLVILGFIFYVYALHLIKLHSERIYQALEKAHRQIKPSQETKVKEKEKKETGSIEQQLLEAKKQLMEQEKLVSMGILTAGIAHEIKNPLNFINNFSMMTISLVDELKEELTKSLVSANEDDKQNILGILNDISTNSEKVSEHGKRAESIIQNMLIHARTSKVDVSEVDVNILLEEYLNLAYHGMRAQNSRFNCKFEKNLDKNIGKIKVNQQSLGRVFLNIINNGMYALDKKMDRNKEFTPTMTITTEQKDNQVTIKIRDNADGIPQSVREKIFEPFFTTKPAGQGTGLGLSICYDIVVNELGGNLAVDSKEGEYTEFSITIPKDKS